MVKVGGAGTPIRATAIALAVVVVAANGGSAGGPHLARRVADRQQAAGDALVGDVRPAMRIGSLDDPVPAQSVPAARRSATWNAPAVRQGATPAGGLTVDVGDLFSTQIVLQPESGEAAQCGAAVRDAQP